MSYIVAPIPSHYVIICRGEGGVEWGGVPLWSPAGRGGANCSSMSQPEFTDNLFITLMMDGKNCTTELTTQKSWEINNEQSQL